RPFRLTPVILGQSHRPDYRSHLRTFSRSPGLVLAALAAGGCTARPTRKPYSGALSLGAINMRNLDGTPDALLAKSPPRTARYALRVLIPTGSTTGPAGYGALKSWQNSDTFPCMS